MDNSNHPLNSTDQTFSEKMPEALRQSILAQAHTELAATRGRERLKTIGYFLGGLVTASVVGVNVTRNIREQKNPPQNNGLAVQDMDFSETEVVDWQEVANETDLDLMANLEDVENLTEEEFAYISSEEDV